MFSFINQLEHISISIRVYLCRIHLRLNNNSNGGHKQSSSSFLSRLSGGSSKTPSPPHAKDNQVVPAPSGEMTPNYPGVPLSD